VAYDLYLKGKEYEMMHWRNPGDDIRGSVIHLFQQAIDLESQFVLVYVP